MDSGLRKYSDLDIVRAVVISAARSEADDCPQKCHILRLSKLAGIFGLQDEILPVLKVLESLREVQNLGAGFWIPAPSRSVFLSEGRWLIISPMPTPYLPPEVEILNSEGFARVAKNPIPNEPLQDLKDWMGAPKSLASWIKAEFNYVGEFFKKTLLNSKSLEFYMPWVNAKNASGIRKNWISIDDVPVSQRSDIQLARNFDTSIWNYYWCVFDGSTLLESNVPVISKEIIRIQYALEIVRGASWREVTTNNDGNLQVFSFKFPLTNDVDRLFQAIGIKVIDENVTRYLINNNYLGVVNSELAALHIKRR